jgi:hypothetical protein
MYSKEKEVWRGKAEYACWAFEQTGDQFYLQNAADAVFEFQKVEHGTR